MHDLQLKRHDSFRHIIANSQLMKKDLIERYAIDAARITVIYPGFDPDTFGFGGADAASQATERQALWASTGSSTAWLRSSAPAAKTVPRNASPEAG